MGYAYRVLLHATIYHSVTSLTILTIALEVTLYFMDLCIVQFVTVIWLESQYCYYSV